MTNAGYVASMRALLLNRIFALSSLAAVQVAVLIVCARGSVWSALFPDTVDSIRIEPAVIDLGDVAINSEMEWPVRLTNLSARPITFSPPKTSCGCLSHTIDTFIVSPNEERLLQFRFSTPSTPQQFRHTVLFHSPDLHRHYWQVRIKGQAIAKIWAVPVSLNLTLDKDGNGKGSIIVEGLVPDLMVSASCDSPNVKVKIAMQSPTTRHVRVSVHDATSSGRGVLKVYNKGKKVILEVMLRWESRPYFRCKPSVIHVADCDDCPDVHNQTIIVLADPERSADGIKATSLFPWLDIGSPEQIGDHVVAFEIGIDKKEVPEVFFENAITITGDGNPNIPASFVAVSAGGSSASNSGRPHVSLERSNQQ